MNALDCSGKGRAIHTQPQLKDLPRRELTRSNVAKLSRRPCEIDQSTRFVVLSARSVIPFGERGGSTRPGGQVTMSLCCVSTSCQDMKRGRGNNKGIRPRLAKRKGRCVCSFGESKFQNWARKVTFCVCLVVWGECAPRLQIIVRRTITVDP
jgi:hypothetical protein